VHSFRVSQRESRQSLATILQSRLHLPYARALRLLRDRQVILDGAVCRNPMLRLGRGQRVAIQGSIPVKRGGSSPPRRERDGGQHKSARRAVAGPRPQVVFMDADVIVVDKPPGITTMRHSSEAAEFGARGRRYLPATLADWLEEMMAGTENPRKKPIRSVHRVDKDTSGLVVFAQTPLAQRELSKQFRAHAVERRYLAIVRGKAKSQRISSYLVDDRGDGRRGTATESGAGKHAVTHVRVVEDLGDYTLVECRLETGRTHQVRIHLGEAGTPICGERVYDRPTHGRPIPDQSGITRVALHATSLGFRHPRTGRKMQWTSPAPKDMAGVIQRIRKLEK
jgi:23S rRNA pseudouridine1911/1915/1917 synthase